MTLVDTSPAQLAKALGRVGRALRYRTRAAREALGITDSEAELLRLVRRQPGVRVQEAAAALGIASNSVSTLVKQLTRANLLARAADPQDGRGVCLHLTSQAESWLADVGSAREAMLARALDNLDPQERTSIEHALPALTRLSEEILNAQSAAQ
jgi:DNA-binding MarR family transcriptional regulator